MPKPAGTRDRLIESARHLFWERGFAGTSMADLLSHANVNSGSFYHFFESKEALLRAVLDTYLAALRPMVVDPAFAGTRDPVERIFAILAGYRERILQTDCQYGCPLGRLALEIDPENRPAHKLIAGNFQGWITAVRECIEQFKTRLPRGTEPEALATYVLAVMEGGVMLSGLTGLWNRSIAPSPSCASISASFSRLEELRAFSRILKSGTWGRMASCSGLATRLAD